jgi:hypothetical protein
MGDRAPAQGWQSRGYLHWRAVLVSPQGPHVRCEPPLLPPKPKDDPPTSNGELFLENPEPRHHTH